ncbi:MULTISPECIES: hypothetical protein [Bacteroidaceae]|uniref:hypothetical protein n=1 Tax=Bacteroidaceae TaxID=815 RepID=UPI00261A9B73|nr:MULTISPECIES: hypothetical protein [Bacteroidaceae]
MKTSKSNLKRHMIIAKTIAVSIAIFMCASCDSGNGKRLADVKSDPAGTYREYLSDVRKLDNLSIKDLAEHLKQWQTVRDSVFRYLERDTLGRFHSVHIEDCERTHDSIRMEFSRLALSNPCTYKDVLLVKEQVSPHLKDAELHHAAEAIRPFFTSLDSHPAYPGNRQRILAAYRDVLTQTIDYGIHCIADLTIYIEKEDAVFRAFLSRLSDFDGVDLSDITHDTERCCSQVFLAAERNDITYQDAMVYLAMRTNRRLIQNIQTCIDNIREKKVRTPAQAQAYIWMLLQPYSSMDGFCMALLSSEERRHLDTLAMQTSDAFEVLGKILQSGNNRLDELPGMLLEAFIHTL